MQRLETRSGGAHPRWDGLVPCSEELQAMDRLLTAEEIAERLGMKIDWVWAQARAGRIPHVRLGRYRRFRESAIEAWLSELETGGMNSTVNHSASKRRRG